MRVVEEFRNFYLTQRAIMKGRRNALRGNELKEQISGRKLNFSLRRHFPAAIDTWQNKRRDSWNDTEVKRMIKAQWPVIKDETVMVRSRSLSL